MSKIQLVVEQTTEIVNKIKKITVPETVVRKNTWFVTTDGKKHKNKFYAENWQYCLDWKIIEIREPFTLSDAVKLYSELLQTSGIFRLYKSSPSHSDRLLGREYHFVKRTFDRVIHYSITWPLASRPT
jgi:hypothetical protein